ncbi:hypothetical protein FRC08_004051 [Ceratobasidium sp. 394]|nr:hypothetical protein FRC08_004051 [Ceratobasidium sp. 394]
MSSSHSPDSPQSSHPGSSPDGAEPVTQHDGSPVVASAIPPSPFTLADAPARVRSSPSWIGNSSGLIQNTEWVEDSRTRSSFLRLKSDATGEDLPVDGDGNVLVCWVGQVAMNGSVLRADGGWKLSFRDAYKHKRIVRSIKPPSNLSRDLYSLWEAQIRGAKAIVERSRRLEDGSEAKVKFCFLERDTGSLKARSSMFQKGGDTWETDTPEGLRYSTWDMSTEVRSAFDEVRSKGFTPRVLEAYDELDSQIHPNLVPAKLTGAIVYMTCTLERMLFTRGRITDDSYWMMFANVVKIQVADSPSTSNPPPASSSKRKAPDTEDGAPDGRSRRHLPVD